MRTGQGSGGNARTEAMMPEIVSLTTMLLNASLKDAAVYAESAGRKTVAPRDIHLALMRLVVPNSVFWTAESFETDAAETRELLFGDYESDEEAETELPMADADDEVEKWVPSDDVSQLAVEMNNAQTAFDAWHPDAPLLQAIKRATQNIVKSES